MNFVGARAVLRLAARNIGRSKGRSILITLMVVLPVAAMSAAMTLSSSTTLPRSIEATYRMGQADLIVVPQQSGATEEDLAATLPHGSAVEPVVMVEGRVLLPGRQYQIGWWSINIDGLAEGMLNLVDGRLPNNADEIAISPPLASLGQFTIGDKLALKDRSPATVVGLVESPIDLNARFALEASPQSILASGVADEGMLEWLVKLPEGVDAGNIAGLTYDTFDPDPNVQFLARTRSQIIFSREPPNLAVLVLGSLALVEAGLIAAAAFAVGIRRRQRELGLLAAVGASRRHLAGSVLAEGLLTGIAASFVGLVAWALLIVIALSPFLDDLTGKRNAGLMIDPVALLAAGLLGTAAAVTASAVPAWSASRLHVLDALAARRPPMSPGKADVLARRCVHCVGRSHGYNRRRDALQWDAISTQSDQYALISTLLLAGGAIIGVFGFGATSPWLLERFELLSQPPTARPRESPFATRLAHARDMPRSSPRCSPPSRRRSRSPPTWRATTRPRRRNGVASLLPDQIMVQGENPGETGPLAAAAVDTLASATMHEPLPADAPSGTVYAEDPSGPGGFFGQLTIGDENTLVALGAESAATALERGDAVAIVNQPTGLQGVSIVVTTDYGDTPAGPTAAPTRRATVPVAEVAIGIVSSAPTIVISPAMADQLHLVDGYVSSYVIRLTAPGD